MCILITYQDIIPNMNKFHQTILDTKIWNWDLKWSILKVEKMVITCMELVSLEICNNMHMFISYQDTIQNMKLFCQKVKD